MWDYNVKKIIIVIIRIIICYYLEFKVEEMFIDFCLCRMDVDLFRMSIDLYR